LTGSPSTTGRRRLPAERPKVFQPGTLTVVFGKDGQAVYAGGNLLTMAYEVSVDGDRIPCVGFRKASVAEETVLEEEMRAVRALGLHITRD
jgi:hypothetical protein